MIIVVANLLLSLRGAGIFPRDIGLRFVAMSTVFYLVVSIQGSLQAQMAINQSVHFSDWVVGHSHLAMLGFATFAAAGGLVHVWQRMPTARYNARALEWAYRLLLIGVVLMVVDLTAAGIVEARVWQSGAPWLDSVRAARPYWIVRALAAIPLGGGFIALLVGLTTGTPGAGLRVVDESVGSSRYVRCHRAWPPRGLGGIMSSGGRALRTAYVVASVAGVLFFALSVALLAVWPGRVLEQQTRAMAPEHSLGLSSSEERGRAIYSREGCAYCHTQQVRYLPTDVARFGAPTMAWETRLDYPQLWGTRRIGPDLSRVGGTRSEDWHFAHLFSPRSVVSDSVMPAYRSLFAGWRSGRGSQPATSSRISIRLGARGRLPGRREKPPRERLANVQTTRCCRWRSRRRC